MRKVRDMRRQTKIVLFSFITLLLLVVGATAVLLAQGQGDSEEGSDPGPYVRYSAEAFDAAKDQKRVIFFHASWCPSCRSANRDINANLELIPEGTVVFKTDYDKERELKRLYAITHQHTFVYVDANGEIIEKWSGGGAEAIANYTSG